MKTKPANYLVAYLFCGAGQVDIGEKLGTTLKVAAELGRNAVGYDLSTKYCELATDQNKQGVL